MSDDPSPTGLSFELEPGCLDTPWGRLDADGEFEFGDPAECRFTLDGVRHVVRLHPATLTREQIVHRILHDTDALFSEIVSRIGKRMAGDEMPTLPTKH